MAGSKAFSAATAARLRAELRAWVDREHGGNTSAAARALRLSQPAVRDVLLGNRGVGAKLLEAFAAASGRSMDELVGRAAPNTDEPPAWGSLPGYGESERVLRAENPHRYLEATYLRARRLRGVLPLELPVTPASLRRALTFIEENTATDVSTSAPKP